MSPSPADSSSSTALLGKVHPFVHLILRLALGILFIQSGWEKWQHWAEFHQAVLNYKMLSPTLAYFYASTLPWFEILAGGYLVLGLFMRFSAGLTALMLASFIVAIAIVLGRGDAVDCGCFVGGRSEPVTPALLWRDLALLLGCAYLLWKPQAPWTLDQILSEPSN